jgi:sigma-E factor negative regulatory protein RseA
MSEKTREHISSLMDGEISPETSRFLVRRLGSDKDLCATWARYHLVRDCLRHPDGGAYGSDLCQRVSRVLRDEPPARGHSSLTRRWLRPVAGGAIAAAVALMAVVLVDPGRATLQPEAANLATAESEASFVNPEGLRGLPSSRVASLNPTPSGNGRINHYLLRHYQATGGNNGRTIVSFVPVMVQARAAEAPADAATAEAADEGAASTTSQ